MKPDKAHTWTDEQLKGLESRIAAEYKKAAEELQEKIDDYFEQFKKRDAEQLQLLQDGKITRRQYTQWRLAQIGRGKRFEALRDRVAERMTKANTVAAAYINDATPGLYSLNRNYAAYTIESQVGRDVGFDLWDEQTVQRLIVEQPDLMPYYPEKRAVKRGIDLAYGKRQITAQITSGILQGESIKHLADRLQTNIPDMNRNSAIRAARTAVTGAQNAGRMDSYHAAEKMGIELEREWLATLDNRTRHAHRILDRQRAKMSEPFRVDGYEIWFPGDTSAPGYLVYNCRCTLDSEVKGVPKDPNPLRRAIDPETGKSVLISDMSYAQWESWKSSGNRYVWETYQKKGKNLSGDKKQFAEYQAVLGKNAPKNFAEFQNLKYNDTEKWDYTKRLVGYMRKYPNSDRRYFDIQESLKAQGINKGVVLPPVQKQAFILPNGKHDSYHIMHRMTERGITDDEVRGYMKDAKVMFVQWGGQRQMFVSDAGISVLTKAGDDWIYKTAWKKNDNDEYTDKIMEAVKNAGL